MKNKKYFIGLDVHKKKTTHVVKDRIGNIILEGETATLYSELYERLEPYLKSSLIGLESCTSYYTLYQNFLKNNYIIKVANTIQLKPYTASPMTSGYIQPLQTVSQGTFCSCSPALSTTFGNSSKCTWEKISH